MIPAIREMGVMYRGKSKIFFECPKNKFIRGDVEKMFFSLNLPTQPEDRQ